MKESKLKPTIVVPFKTNNEDLIPLYMSEFASGADLKASEDSEIFPMEKAVVPTGLFIEIPEGYEGQVRPRSGLAAKYDVTVLNTPGTIDSDYRGEVKVILFNHSDNLFSIKRGDRIAQLVFMKVERARFVVHSELADSVRSEGGFGSTGK